MWVHHRNLIHLHSLLQKQFFKVQQLIGQLRLLVKEASLVNDVFLRTSIYTPHTKALTECETTMNLKTPRQEFVKKHKKQNICA